MDYSDLKIFEAMVDDILLESFPFTIKLHLYGNVFIELHYDKVNINNIIIDISVMNYENIINMLQTIKKRLIDYIFHSTHINIYTHTYKFNENQYIEVTLRNSRIIFKALDYTIEIMKEDARNALTLVNSLIRHYNQFIKLRTLRDTIIYHPENTYASQYK